MLHGNSIREIDGSLGGGADEGSQGDVYEMVPLAL
jgi:hypothetical protein